MADSATPEATPAAVAAALNGTGAKAAIGGGGLSIGGALLWALNAWTTHVQEFDAMKVQVEGGTRVMCQVLAGPPSCASDSICLALDIKPDSGCKE